MPDNEMESTSVDIMIPPSNEEEEVGFSLKKFGKRFKKVAKIATLPTWLPTKMVLKAGRGVAREAGIPVPAFNLLNRARRNAAFAKKVAAVREAANTSPEELQEKMRDERGNPAPYEEAVRTQQNAEEALSNLAQAAVIQNQAFEDQGAYEAYDPMPTEYDENEQVEGFHDDLSLYEWGAMAGEEDEIGRTDILGFSFKKLIKKAGKAIDISRKDNPLRSAVAQIPGIGPQITAGADMLAKARSGDKAAQQKIEDVKKLAADGDPDGQKALNTLLAAQALSPQRKIASIFGPYEYGARAAV